MGNRIATPVRFAAARAQMPTSVHVDRLLLAYRPPVPDRNFRPVIRHGIEYVFLGFEVIIEIAARQAGGIGNVAEGGLVIATHIKQPVGGLDDALAIGGTLVP